MRPGVVRATDAEFKRAVLLLRGVVELTKAAKTLLADTERNGVKERNIRKLGILESNAGELQWTFVGLTLGPNVHCY
jgi:hypothetical protein